MIEYLIGDIATVINIVAKGSAVLLLLLISEALLWYSRVKISREYTAAKKNVANLADIESVSLIYYRKRQMLGVVRAGVFLVAILFTALLYDFQTFGVLALALSALVIIQRENINSLIAYFFVLSNFNVGDDIRLGDALGEIVRVSPFQTVLNGKEDNGEYNGRLISIPNYKILIENVTKQELKSDTYRRIILKVVYENESYAVNFGEFIRKTRSFLDDFLPKRHLGEVGNFKNFAGLQYKINYEYDEEGRIIVRIVFISRPHDIVDRKEQIIEFLEGMRAPRGENRKSEKEKKGV